MYACMQTQATGRVTSGPAAPAGIARNNPKFAEEFDKLAKVAGGGADAPEPTFALGDIQICLLYTSPSPRDKRQSRMPSSA